MAAQWLAMNRSNSLDEFRATFRDEGGIPWVHTIGADSEGTAYFIDAGSVPALTDTAEAQHRDALQNDPLVQAGAALGFLLLDGSTSDSEWDEDADPTRPGLEPASAAPELLRDDFTSNSNDNHWLTNPLAPLVDFPYIYGGERQPQNLPRTRMSLRMLLEDGDDSGYGDDGLFSLDEMLDTAMNGRAIFAELLKDEVAARCDGEQFVILNEDSVDITDACVALAAWDGQLTLDSRGAAVWREFIASGTFDDREWTAGGGVLFDTPFDPDNPVETPSSLARRPEGGDDPVLTALAVATTRLAEANVAPDAPLGDIQFAPRGNANNARHGGLDIEGAFSISDYRVKSASRDSTLADGVPRADPITPRSGLTPDGYVVNAGNSWVAGIAFTDNGPVCQALMTTGQSEDPDSPYFADQAELFTTQSWRPCLYTEEDIAADPALRIEVVSSGE
jgi:acyl-homoserine-lactone acylase